MNFDFSYLDIAFKNGSVITVNETDEIAEAVGVSRQSVSKWEQGVSDPSTSNLFALAKLFGVSVEELLKEVE